MEIVSESNVMLKIKTLLSVAIAVSGAAVSSSFGQGCDTCAQAQFAPVQVAPMQFAPVQVGAPCHTCGPVTVAPPVHVVASRPVSGYGGGGCGAAGCLGGGIGVGGKLDELKAKCAHTKAINERTTARNNAWPKPFDCADRQAYFSVWEPMIDQGWEEQCVLTAAHFDPESHELNKFGQTAVAGIMQNNPSHRRVVFIHRDVNDQINQQRRSMVEDTINTFYGHSNTAQIAFSNKRPVTTSGQRGAQIQEEWMGAQATPAIAVSTGGTVADSVTQ